MCRHNWGLFLRSFDMDPPPLCKGKEHHGPPHGPQPLSTVHCHGRAGAAECWAPPIPGRWVAPLACLWPICLAPRRSTGTGLAFRVHKQKKEERRKKKEGRRPKKVKNIQCSFRMCSGLPWLLALSCAERKGPPTQIWRSNTY